MKPVKLIALSMSFALVATTPGLGSYQAWALEVRVQGAVGTFRTPVSPAGGFVGAVRSGRPLQIKNSASVALPLYKDGRAVHSVIVPAVEISQPAAIDNDGAFTNAGRYVVTESEGPLGRNQAGAVLINISGETKQALGHGDFRAADIGLRKTYDRGEQFGAADKSVMAFAQPATPGSSGIKPLSGGGGASRGNPPGGDDNSGGNSDRGSNLPKVGFAEPAPARHRDLLTEAFHAHSTKLVDFLGNFGIQPAQVKGKFLQVVSSKDESPEAETVVMAVSYSISVYASRRDTGLAIGTFQAIVDLQTKALALILSADAQHGNNRRVMLEIRVPAGRNVQEYVKELSAQLKNDYGFMLDADYRPVPMKEGTYIIRGTVPAANAGKLSKDSRTKSWSESQLEPSVPWFSPRAFDAVADAQNGQLLDLQRTGNVGANPHPTEEQLKKFIDTYSTKIMSVRGVSGVGIGIAGPVDLPHPMPGLVIYLDGSVPEAKAKKALLGKVPALKKYPVRYEVTGPIVP